MKSYLAKKKLSAEAQAVMKAGRTIWRAYFAETDPRGVRDELQLDRPDVGWYQVRTAIKKRNASGDLKPVSFSDFNDAYKALSEKLALKVYEIGIPQRLTQPNSPEPPVLQNGELRGNHGDRYQFPNLGRSKRARKAPAAQGANGYSSISRRENGAA